MPSNFKSWLWSATLASLTLGAAGCDSQSSAPRKIYTDVPQGKWLNAQLPSDVLGSYLCSSPKPGDTPLRRLTNLEYSNTLLDLGFAAESVQDAIESLPSEPESLGFRNGASALTVTSLLAQKYKSIAEQLTQTYSYPCTAADESACADQMIEQVGTSTHRRPLTSDEALQYRAIYDLARTQSNHNEALGWVAQAMLQSPHFLYRVEIPDAEQIEPVTGYEMANRLSYMLWQSPPDDELLDAALVSELETPEQIRAQAERMLAAPKAKNVLDYFEQWLDLDELHVVVRDPDLYPHLSPQLAPLFLAESRSFLLDLLRNSGSNYRDLLSADYTFANAELAEHYGLDQVDGDAFVRVNAPDRRGVLTQGMLAVLDGPTRTSIVRRGLKVRTDFLCQLVPAPPDTVNLTLDGISATLSQAERLEQHRADASCAKCHSKMDPIGEIFEGFDAVGRRRTVDEFGNAISEEGELTSTIDADGPVSGVAELAERLSGSLEAQQCYMIQNLRYYLGREIDEDDLCTQAQLTQYWRDRDLNLVELLLGITQTDAFLYKSKRVDALPGDSNQGGAP